MFTRPTSSHARTNAYDCGTRLCEGTPQTRRLAHFTRCCLRNPPCSSMRGGEKESGAKWEWSRANDGRGKQHANDTWLTRKGQVWKSRERSSKDSLTFSSLFNFCLAFSPSILYHAPLFLKKKIPVHIQWARAIRAVLAGKQHNSGVKLVRNGK